jgi:hypothetical protein
MTMCTHKCIACGPTGNLQGSVKIYCLKTDCILKRRSFTPLPMPDWIIKRIDHIRLREKQGREFWFVHRSKEPYEWTNMVPEDDPEFQGLLEEEAPFPDVSVEIPGVVLEEEEDDGQVVTDEPKVPFEALAAVALENVGIDMADSIRAAWAAGDDRDRAGAPAMPQEPRLVEAYNDKIVYNITINLPNARLILPDDYLDAPPIEVAGDKPEAIPARVPSPQAER